MTQPFANNAHLSDAPDSVRKFLKERRLTAADEAQARAETRLRIENSGLPRLMWDVCAAINHEAGGLLVEGHSYLPPDSLLNAFIYMANNTEYILQLEAHAHQPRVVFVARQWRDRPRTDFLGWVSRLLDPARCYVSVPYSCEIGAHSVSERDIRLWFFYLVSGLKRAYLPSRAKKDYSEKGSFTDALKSSGLFNYEG